MKEENKVSTKVFYLSTFFVLFIALAALLMPYLKNDEVVYVDSNALYEQYQGKIDLEEIFLKETAPQKKIIDSLEQQLSYLYEDYQVYRTIEMQDKISASEKTYKRVYNEYNKNVEDKREELITQIMEQINSYTKQFGEKNNYKFILGAIGNGTILFAEDSKEVTNELLEYINTEYKTQKTH